MTFLAEHRVFFADGRFKHQPEILMSDEASISTIFDISVS